MLPEAKFPNHYWGEALYMTVHVLKLNPTFAQNNQVLDKFWFGKNVNYNHLRVFGCGDFVYI